MSADAQARRAAIQLEVTAVAVRYQSDTAPEAPGERTAGILQAVDYLAISDDVTDQRYALLELAGRCQAWLEDIEATSQNPNPQEDPA